MSEVRDTYIRTVSAKGSLVLAVTSSRGAYRSTDDGNNWALMDTSLSDPDIESFTFVGPDIYASTTFTGFIFKSTDDGLTWTISSNGLSQYSSVHKVIQHDSNLFAAAGDGVYKSTDNGNTWNLAINGMTSTVVLTVFAYGNTILAGTAEGFIFRSTDEGDIWTDAGDGLPPLGSNSAVEVFAVKGQNLLCGTYATGIWLRPVNEVVTSVADQGQENMPLRFDLGQNYPNPFNPSTVIKYSIPQNGFVTLKIYNSIGQEVATLVNEKKDRGNYSINFDAGKSSLASGVYIYRLQVNGYSASKKMLLLK